MNIREKSTALCAPFRRPACLFSTDSYVGKRSPDHADAAIWGLTDLMLDHEPQPDVKFFNIPPHLARW
jgi:phage terminase large subunit-like protein